MNVAIIIPTGINAAIGGDCGDATPVIKLFSPICDRVLTHPNVVNAADINEMPENAWYVEGSILDRFLEGAIDLKRPRMNRLLVIMDRYSIDTMNACGAARATLGIPILTETFPGLTMKGGVENGKATYDFGSVDALCSFANAIPDWDALAIHSPIEVETACATKYFIEGGPNPWGKVESEVSRAIAKRVSKPVAHAPMESGSLNDFKLVVDDSKASEMVSVCYLHCVLKGLSRAPRIVERGFNVSELDALITPSGCIGRPHKACFKRGIPVIAVNENTTCEDKSDGRIIYVDNYLEAAGVICSYKAGILPKSVRIQ